MITADPVVLREFDRYRGAQAEGAIPNGTRIVKTASERGDFQQDDSRGTVIGSMTLPAATERRTGVRYFYFVTWDRAPHVTSGVASFKIRPLP